MGTSASIGYTVQNGIRASYLNSDGDPETAGQELVNCYTTIKDVDTLVGLGDLSSLGPSIHETTAYARDRGEDWAEVAPRYYRDKMEWIQNGPSAEFFYLFDCETLTWRCFLDNERFISLPEPVVAETESDSWDSWRPAR